ncbi:hypothetical protein C1X35_17715 [Pseudomonas sp. FW306-1C-G01A]|jgi:hypothetical protein|nr:hypothetical protein [Pseudomonas mandelii]OOL37776.1 hypothetical protein BOO94_11295 [Pseudomonas sp. FSL W5-0299]PMV87208.1 hypothetical protein C1X56_12835 [Pseudomonas sp. GW101-1A09]PMV99054.1 hypothetical protein C1X51_01070 [Pseudomonas sp. FW306-2-2C-B10A]PMW02126.1 hypothetical protein C1X55_03315 [Pseudomonas sp. GW460-C8]PMW08319.1 hypothetical protein C1X50_01040 [Pseudomonas sp. MPR-TSA4]PMW16487.1 hypothetical protein C1X40_18930 [Pseudomonas sp. GW456-11-11-14-TSB2]PMW2212
MGHLSNQWAGSRVLFEKSTSDRKKAQHPPPRAKIGQDVTRIIKQCLEPSRHRGMREGSEGFGVRKIAIANRLAPTGFVQIL